MVYVSRQFSDGAFSYPRYLLLRMDNNGNRIDTLPRVSVLTNKSNFCVKKKISNNHEDECFYEKESAVTDAKSTK